MAEGGVSSRLHHYDALGTKIDVQLARKNINISI